ncbi:YggS family pyridoxal phosphate-dependent enzyme [Aestuariibacter sp. A3R04]|uniref:YggS family pyridoxal phosphate-dependent enzyme n=1 Tax=Aestuariibacter sp. A3R04 TaxID=2841571 RepID=UPI001C082041|nr:YggS family pyridoxal phosphate-dependent enzyme [Aestuariibacter sp. A3R04]MBU3021498.1 YggS family pyridoxal phosphate-dependent enzyme [Aestuariibacter sp. A3R04]
MQTIAERLKSAHLRMERATANAHRPPKSVQLLAVSKTKPVSDITQAYEAGQRLFGENYVQEGVEKIQALTHLKDIEWHMIGPIQSNKTRIVAEHFHWVQSVDREKTARRLNDQRPATMSALNVCIQLNIDGESSKSGIGEQELPALIETIAAMPNLRLRGLMAIPEATTDTVKQATTLGKLAELFTQYHTKLSDFDTLSVGMSGDLEAAIAHGSTMVRIGTAIFGSRNNG